MKLRRAGLATALGLGLMSLPFIANAQGMSSPMFVQSTPNYTVALTIGPPQQMMSPSDAMHGATGEVMVNTMPTENVSTGGPEAMAQSQGEPAPNMNMTMNDMTDQGMQVNHHLEVHVMQGNTVVDSVTPVIRIIDNATGESRDLPNIMSMYDAQMGMSDFHYGQNAYLPDGTYTILVMLGNDTATFHDVMVSGGSSMPMARGSMGNQPSMGNQSSMGMTPGPSSSNSLVAADGATLSSQPASVQSMFNAVWGGNAAAEWVREHNALLAMH